MKHSSATVDTSFSYSANVLGGWRRMFEMTKEQTGPDVVVLHITGRIAMGKACQDIDAQVDELIREKVTKVVLDLEHVDRVDSTGFGTIVLCAGKLRKSGGELRVAGAKGIVAEIAHSSQIPRIVPFHASVQDAIANFAVV